MPKSVESLDLRVRRTRMMIEKAFIELLQKQEFQSITVQNIADEAMVNRATFYDHFPDKYALFESTMKEMFRQDLERKLPSSFTNCLDNLQFLIATLCEFMAQVDDHCSYTNPQGLPSFDEQIVGSVSELLLKWLAASGIESQTDAATLSADMASWAIYGAAHHWSLQKPREPVTEFAARVTPMVASIIE